MSKAGAFDLASGVGGKIDKTEVLSAVEKYHYFLFKLTVSFSFFKLFLINYTFKFEISQIFIISYIHMLSLNPVLSVIWLVWGFFLF